MICRAITTGACAWVILSMLPSVTVVRAQAPETFTAPQQEICEGQSALYTLNITAPDKSNTLINVTATGDPPVIPNAAYDNGSQSVSGVGKIPGKATIK